LAFPGSLPPNNPARGSWRKLTQLAEDVYAYRSLGVYATFIVTNDGVVVSDHIGQSPDLRWAKLYKAAIASVTDKPVRYVVYHHDHADGITGMSVFSETAQYVSHRLAAAKIAARKDPLQPVPTILVDDRKTLELGGKKIELYYIGRGHTDNMLVTLYPARRILWAGDFVGTTGLGGRLDPEDSYPDEYVKALRWIEQNLNSQFDLVVAGHGSKFGTPDDVRRTREYYEDLNAAIRAARTQKAADNSPEMVTIVRAALSPKFGNLPGFGNGIGPSIQGVIASWNAGR
jgi:glyoxylase-like metal-dependent hydrolase (beta-lactamase superfamily II)